MFCAATLILHRYGPANCSESSMPFVQDEIFSFVFCFEVKIMQEEIVEKYNERFEDEEDFKDPESANLETLFDELLKKIEIAQEKDDTIDELKQKIEKSQEMSDKKLEKKKTKIKSLTKTNQELEENYESCMEECEFLKKKNERLGLCFAC